MRVRLSGHWPIIIGRRQRPRRSQTRRVTFDRPKLSGRFPTKSMSVLTIIRFAGSVFTRVKTRPGNVKRLRVEINTYWKLQSPVSTPFAYPLRIRTASISSRTVVFQYIFYDTPRPFPIWRFDFRYPLETTIAFVDDLSSKENATNGVLIFLPNTYLGSLHRWRRINTDRIDFRYTKNKRISVS